MIACMPGEMRVYWKGMMETYIAVLFLSKSRDRTCVGRLATYTHTHTHTHTHISSSELVHGWTLGKILVYKLLLSVS